jgi:hypothetical protein
MNRIFTNLIKERNRFMKAEFEVAGAAVSDSLPLKILTAPSLRVPVTQANRTLLRWLRAAELSDWEAGRTCFRNGSTAKLASFEPQRI